MPSTPTVTDARRPIAAAVCALALLPAVATAGTIGGLEAVRSRVFGETTIRSGDLHGRELVVVFTPDVLGCAAVDAELARAVQRFAEGHPEAVALTLVPAGMADKQSAFGVALPGRVIAISAPTYRSERLVAPLPRLEVWTAAGKLLLLKSYRFGLEEEFHEELERAVAMLPSAGS